MLKLLQLSSSIESAPMIDAARGKILRNHGIRTVEDLLWYLPFRYEDWRKLKNIGQLQPGESATICGAVTRSTLQVTPRRRFKILEAIIRDGSGSLVARFFNQPYLKDQFAKGRTVILHGQAKGDPFSAMLEMESP